MNAATLKFPASLRTNTNWIYDWVTTVDHKRIGILYLLTSLFFFVIGGIESLLIRIQLAHPNSTFLTPDGYNQTFTMHGTTMIFLVVMPVLVGFANYFIPLMIGARDMALPRLNAMSYWFFLFGGLVLHFSFLTGGAPNVGWFSYAPLSESPYTSTRGPDYWAISLLILGTGSIAAALNILVTVLTERAPGMTLRNLPLFVWMNFINSFLILLALPALNAGLVMLLVDRQLAASFFLPQKGGDAVLWQHIFWTFGHPEVYIMALPAFGMISEIIPVFSRKPIFGYEFVAASTVAIALLSFGVWAHHMFVVGLGRPMDLFFAATSMLIAVPTGVKVFNWAGTLWGGAIRITTAMDCAVAFLIQFTLGGLSGITFAVTPLDWQMNNTYYVVAHFHYVLFGGTFFAVLAATYYWFPKMTGRMLSEKLSKLAFWMTVIGFNTTFFVQHLLGFLGMSRRVYTYPDLPYWGTLNMVSTIGSFILGASMLVLIWNIWVSLRHGQPAGNNPWNAWTLEWATTSPPPPHNFDELPEVRSRRPLWDKANPQSPDEPSPLRVDLPHIEKNKAAMGSFILSEAFFFVVLIGAYVYYNVLHKAPGPNAGNALDRATTGIYTICLLASSVTLWFGERKLEHKDQKGFRLWMGITILLGLVFIIGQGREYLHLFESGIKMNTNLFATTFFTLTGFHGLHVCVGLIGLMIVLVLAFAGDFNTGRTEVVPAMAWYWHFVDAVWVVVFTTIYLMGPSL